MQLWCLYNTFYPWTNLFTAASSVIVSSPWLQIYLRYTNKFKHIDKERKDLETTTEVVFAAIVDMSKGETTLGQDEDQIFMLILIIELL